jgi:hypothetical protein
MGDVIIDTNVMVVANRQNENVAITCVDACVKFLIHARDSCTLLLDGGDEIRAEYTKALQMGRPAFAALARKTGTPVSNAIDSDWAEYRDTLDAHGISVNFVCGWDALRWFRT